MLFFKYEEAERDVGGQLRQGGQTGRAVAGRFPVVGRHGEERFQLGGGHRDGPGDLPLPDGAEAFIRHLLHRVFVGRLVEDGLHLVQMLRAGHDVEHPPAGAQHPQKLLPRKGREAVQQQVGPSGADRLGNAAVVPALAAACIQQVQRGLRPGRETVFQTQLPHRLPEDAIVSGIQKGAAGGDHLFAVAGGLGAHALHWQQVPVALSGTVKAVAGGAFQILLPGQRPAAQRTLPWLRLHRCDPRWEPLRHRGRSYTLRSW